MEGEPSPQEKQAWFASLCEALQENRADTTEVDLEDRMCPRLSNHRAVQLGRALRGNTAVFKLVIMIGRMTLAGAGGIAHLISSSVGTLTEISILVKDDVPDEDREVKAAVVDRFLAAAAVNGRIRKLEIYDAYGSHSLASCLTALKDSLRILRLSSPLVGAQDQEVVEDAELIDEAVCTLASPESLRLTQ